MNRTGAIRALPALLTGSVLALAAAHVVFDDDRLVIDLAEASILVVFAVALGFVAVRVARDRFAPDRVSRVVLTGLGSGIVVGALAALYLATRIADGDPTTEPMIVLSIGWSLGVSAGALVGYYVERVRRERAEQARLTGRLTVLQRVLRHNIRNEVAIIRGIAATAAESTDDEALTGRLRTMTDHVDRVHGLSEKANTLTELWNDDETVEADLAATVRAEVSRFRETHPGVDVTLSTPETAPATAHPSAALAVREALDNAATHNDAGELAVDASVSTGSEWVTVEVADDGSSVPEEDLAALAASREFPLQHVTGLGLWVIFWVVELSGGRLDIDNVDPAGVRVRMRFRPVDVATRS
ncbi:HAMP domain-containing histidine kinase [Halobaculum sp. CBA1158]|uniref:sensor histidine kinase n=1 Tax=Halobaculum sp. CBA1158 TaxID=2904243 RepID=UPI001F31E97D|nr:HAMP domain-containing sensor histidine kinase [Halobaculum sp. CBA1158]UIO99178.1 HAMP domain-containing histidine kinase [Halobaculum sp. CBA1158]